MKRETAPEGGRPQRHDQRVRSLPAPQDGPLRAVRVTGLQAAQASVRGQLDAWRKQMAPREFETLVDVLYRMLAGELASRKAKP